MNRFQERKIVECLAYMAGKVDLTDVKAYKLLWLADRLHLGRYARTITGDDYYAMERGPVPSNVKKMVNHKVQSDLFDSTFQVEGKALVLVSPMDAFDYLSDTDRDALDQVLAAYGTYDEKALTEVSHLSPEWNRFRDKLREGRKKSIKMEIDDFFDDFKDPQSLFLRNGEPEIAKSVFYCE